MSKHYRQEEIKKIDFRLAKLHMRLHEVEDPVIKRILSERVDSLLDRRNRLCKGS